MDKHIVTNKAGKELKAAIPTHPGRILKRELEARNIKQSVFALDLHMYPQVLSDIIKGKRGISSELALKLESNLDINAEFWVRMQAHYDLEIKRRQLTEA